MMRALKLFAAAAAAVCAVTAGCASTHAAGPAASAPGNTPPSASAPTTAAAGAGNTSSADGPSASALMVCGTEIKNAVVTVLALPQAPATTSTWTDHLYTCTYHLPSGTLVLSVMESPDTSSAKAYFTTLQHRLDPTTPLTEAEGLGNPGYQSPAGTVVILKDDKTLRVDATALPAASGAGKLSRADVAYEIATDIIGCWTGG